MRLKHLVFLMMMLTFVSTVLGASWVCYDRGEALPSGTACGSDCCITCQDNGWTKPWQYCDASSTCSCDGTGSTPIEPAALSVASPKNNVIYYSNRVTLDAQVSKVVTSIKYKMDSGAETLICNNCQSTGQISVPSTTLPDGAHTLIVKIYEGSVVSDSVTINFVTDTTAPNVLSATPAQASLIESDMFKVTYTEPHVADVKLFYKRSDEATFRSKTSTTCQNGTAVECSIKADLTDYDINDTVEYYFVVTDKGAKSTQYPPAAQPAIQVTLNKDFEPCVENWSCSTWGSCSNSQQSRSCNDLNACGTENSKPALTQSCSSSSGGGGGGGSSSGSKKSSGGGGGGSSSSSSSSTVVKGISYSKLWFTLNADDYEVEVSREGLDVVKFDFSTRNTRTNVRLQITALEKKPTSLPNPEGTLYQHIQVDHTGLENSDLDGNVIFKFKVNKTWFESNELDPESIVMQRFYSNKWNILPTSRIDEDDEYYYYESESPGMSNFAITATPAEEEVKVEETTMPVNENTNSQAPTTETSAQEETKNTSTNQITGKVASDSVTISYGTIKIVAGTMILLGLIAGLFFFFEKMKN